MMEQFLRYASLFAIVWVGAVYLVDRWMKYGNIREWKEMEYKAQHEAGHAAIEVAALQLKRAEVLLMLGETVGGVQEEQQSSVDGKNWFYGHDEFARFHRTATPPQHATHQNEEDEEEKEDE
jgi:hypothetical protein